MNGSAPVPMRDLIRDLSLPAAWPAEVRPPEGGVRVVQTHISAVFIAPRAVFKVKKPVDFGFLDFTSLDDRLHFCREELRLNRRLSPGLYREVVPITRQGGALVFGGPGEAVEWALRMDPLPEDRLLSSLLPQGKVSSADLERVARAIARFHLEAERSDEITHTGGSAAVEVNTEENFSQVAPFVGSTVSPETFDLIALYTRTFREVNAGMMALREADGWIRDCHGDLHSQHVCLTDPVQVFDCIEFSKRFRFCDVLSDAAFLDMDLARLGHPVLGAAFTRAWLAATSQEGLPGVAALHNFYRCYRAVVRGKVEGFRSRDPGVPPAEAESARRSAGEFFLLAERYARSLAPPTLFSLCGLMGSGKSKLARAIGERLSLGNLSSDLTRKELAGLAPTEKRHLGFNQGLYGAEMTDRTYAALFDRARGELSAGRSVILDASFTDPARRQQARRLAAETGARHLLVHLKAGEGLLRERLARRALKASVSDGREELLPRQMAAFVPPDEIPAAELVELDAGAELPAKADLLYRRALSTT